jgi:hypothetical protein
VATPAPNGADLEQVTVAGTRTPAPDRTGASVAVLTRKEIESLPGGDTQPLSNALATQPGIVNDTFGFGVHTRGADGNVAYVIDGIPLFTVPLGNTASETSSRSDSFRA